MLPITKLSIGNYVADKLQGNAIVKIVTIYPTELLVTGENKESYSLKLKNAGKVALSADLLRKCGCKQNKEDKFFWRTPVLRRLFTFRASDRCIPISFDNYHIIEINSLHGFQNLCTLMGDEIYFKD